MWDIFLVDDCERYDHGDTPGQVVLDGTRKQVGETRKSKSREANREERGPPWPLLQFLLPGSCPKFLL